MHACLRAAVAGGLAIAGFSLFAPTAAADGIGDESMTRRSESTTAVTDASVEGAVLATQAQIGPGGRRGSGSPLPPPSCSFTWYHHDGMDLDGTLIIHPQVNMAGHIVWRPADSEYATSDISQGPGRHYEVACVRGDDPRYNRVIRQVFVPARTPREIAEEAFNSGMLPVPALSVSMSPPIGIDQLVGLETWLWFDEARWQSESVDIPALFVTLTLTIEPKRVVWHMGDEGTKPCEGRGVQWSSTAQAAGAEHCGYTYRRSSAGESDLTFDGHAEVEWEASWSENGGPGTSLGPVYQTTPFQVQVAEAQAINVGR